MKIHPICLVRKSIDRQIQHFLVKCVKKTKNSGTNLRFRQSMPGTAAEKVSVRLTRNTILRSEHCFYNSKCNPGLSRHTVKHQQMAAPHDGSINSRLRMPDNKGHIVPGNSGTNDKKERNDKENLSLYQAHGYRADHTGSNTQVKRRHQKDRETGG